METATGLPSAATLAHWEKKTPPLDLTFPPLENVTRTHVDTAAAAYYLNRRPQTLRGWHCHGDYPTAGLRPLVLNGRLNWSVSAIKSAMGVQ